ncbi:hypothetical protein ACWGGS_04940 [Streptomyces decoyicus]
MAGASVSAGDGERLLEELVRTAQQASPAELPTVLERYAEAMGMGRAVIYLADLQQRLLLPLVEGEPDREVDASLAGWAYRTNSLPKCPLTCNDVLPYLFGFHWHRVWGNVAGVVG